MRLLERDDNGEISLTGDFGGDNKIPAYAVLSHTWGPEEVTFTDLKNGTAEDRAGYKKIRFCAEQARRDGLRHFWVDTCCIDKSDSDEHQKAIQSMFRWYRDAARCYVYLSDVSINGCQQTEEQRQCTSESAFQASRWHTRGWTLQELLAPSIVEFFTQECTWLGDKRSLEQQIHKISKIPILALQGAPLSQFGVDERLAWAEKRQTTLEEDQAYCLQGIFGIYIPVMYGEGKENAIRRLKKEINEASNPERQRQAEERERLPKNVFAHVNVEDSRHGISAVSRAAANSNDVVVQRMLEEGADIHTKDSHGRTLLSYAAEDGRDAVVLRLLEQGADVNSKNWHGQTPLSYAAENGHSAVVQQLLERDTNINLEDEHRRTPLLCAAEYGHEAVIKLLLATGKASVNAENIDGCTPFTYAAKNGHTGVIKLLLATEVEVDARNRWDRTPLSYAAENGHKSIVRLLLDTGKVDADLKDDSGRTPLSWAAGKGRAAVVELLLNTGQVDVNSEDMLCRTPLSYGAENGDEAVIKLLLVTRKADIDLESSSGRTPLSYAAERGHDAVVTLLQTRTWT